jgi:hypothetical protein
MLFGCLLKLKRLRWLWQIEVPRSWRSRLPGHTVASAPGMILGPEARRVIEIDQKLLKAKRKGEGFRLLAEHVEQVAEHCWEQAVVLVRRGLVTTNHAKAGKGA